MNLVEKKEASLARGDKIIARNDMFGYYFAARVSRVLDSNYANVKFDDGSRKSNMPKKHIIRVNTVPVICLYPGDHVMAKVLNEFDMPCYVPGVVQLIKSDFHKRVYTILYFNGQEGDNIASELIKISQKSYGHIVNYIRSILGDNTGLTILKVYQKPNLPEAPPRRPHTPNDMDKISKDIIYQIKGHLNSLKLDEKYDRMYIEISSLKKNQKHLKSDLEGKFKLLRNDFEEWKHQEPPLLIPDPSKYIYIKKNKSKKIKPELTVNNSDGDDKNNAYEIVVSDRLSFEERLIRLRSELREIQAGEEILARWPDDGWYYKSIVKENLGDYRYLVEDSLRDYETIYREDMIADIKKPSYDLEVGDPVIALHPNFDFSYAPGQVIHVSNDMSSYHVRFYDFSEGAVNCYEIFKLPRLKFQIDVDKILELEKRWVGQKVISRNHFSRVYELGRVIGQVNTGRQYVIEWPDGTESIQSANHIYGKFTRNKSIFKNEYVLAPKEEIFLPGRITARRGNQLIVRFCDGSVDENVNEEHCFWLSKDYYEDACQFCRHENDIDYYYEHNNRERMIFLDDNSFKKESLGRQTPVIDAREFFTGKSNLIKLKRN